MLCYNFRTLRRRLSLLFSAIGRSLCLHACSSSHCFPVLFYIIAVGFETFLKNSALIRICSRGGQVHKDALVLEARSGGSGSYSQISPSTGFMTFSSRLIGDINWAYLRQLNQEDVGIQMF